MYLYKIATSFYHTIHSFMSLIIPNVSYFIASYRLFLTLRVLITLLLQLLTLPHGG